MLAGIGTSSLLVRPHGVSGRAGGGASGAPKACRNHELVCNQQEFPVIQTGAIDPANKVAVYTVW